MTIEYALSRGEVAKGYLYSWRYSSLFRRQMLLAALAIGALSLAERRLMAGDLRASDFRVALLWAFGLFAFMPIWLFVRAKQQTRTLQLADDGLVTSMGGRSTHLPWSSLSAISDAKEFVIIARRNMNAFYVPKRAFTDDKERSRFIQSAASHLEGYRAVDG